MMWSKKEGSRATAALLVFLTCGDFLLDKTQVSVYVSAFSHSNSICSGCSSVSSSNSIRRCSSSSSKLNIMKDVSVGNAAADFAEFSPRKRKYVMPMIYNWKRNEDDNSITGLIHGSPAAEDGDVITTSPLKEDSRLEPESVVQTKSGVRYLLSTQAGYDHNYNSFDSESAAIAVEELRQLEQSHAVNPLPLSNGYVVPVISRWRKNEDNSVTGVVLGDSIVTDDREDNDVVTITTSPIVKGQFEKGCIIETSAGTRYYLDVQSHAFPQSSKGSQVENSGATQKVVINEESESDEIVPRNRLVERYKVELARRKYGSSENVDEGLGISFDSSSKLKVSEILSNRRLGVNQSSNNDKSSPVINREKLSATQRSSIQNVKEKTSKSTTALNANLESSHLDSSETGRAITQISTEMKVNEEVKETDKSKFGERRTLIDSIDRNVLIDERSRKWESLAARRESSRQAKREEAKEKWMTMNARRESEASALKKMELKPPKKVESDAKEQQTPTSIHNDGLGQGKDIVQNKANEPLQASYDLKSNLNDMSIGALSDAEHAVLKRKRLLEATMRSKKRIADANTTEEVKKMPEEKYQSVEDLSASLDLSLDQFELLLGSSSVPSEQRTDDMFSLSNVIGEMKEARKTIAERTTMKNKIDITTEAVEKILTQVRMSANQDGKSSNISSNHSVLSKSEENLFLEEFQTLSSQIALLEKKIEGNMILKEEILQEMKVIEEVLEEINSKYSKKIITATLNAMRDEVKVMYRKLQEKVLMRTELAQRTEVLENIVQDLQDRMNDPKEYDTLTEHSMDVESDSLTYSLSGLYNKERKLLSEMHDEVKAMRFKLQQTRTNREELAQRTTAIEEKVFELQKYEFSSPSVPSEASIERNVGSMRGELRALRQKLQERAPVRAELSHRTDVLENIVSNMQSSISSRVENDKHSTSSSDSNNSAKRMFSEMQENIKTLQVALKDTTASREVLVHRTTSVENKITEMQQHDNSLTSFYSADKLTDENASTKIEAMRNQIKSLRQKLQNKAPVRAELSERADVLENIVFDMQSRIAVSSIDLEKSVVEADESLPDVNDSERSILSEMKDDVRSLRQKFQETRTNREDIEQRAAALENKVIEMQQYDLSTLSSSSEINIKDNSLSSNLGNMRHELRSLRQKMQEKVPVRAELSERTDILENIVLDMQARMTESRTDAANSVVETNAPLFAVSSSERSILSEMKHDVRSLRQKLQETRTNREDIERRAVVLENKVVEMQQYDLSTLQSSSEINIDNVVVKEKLDLMRNELRSLRQKMQEKVPVRAELSEKTDALENIVSDLQSSLITSSFALDEALEEENISQSSNDVREGEMDSSYISNLNTRADTFIANVQEDKQALDVHVEDIRAAHEDEEYPPAVTKNNIVPSPPTSTEGDIASRKLGNMRDELKSLRRKIRKKAPAREELSQRTNRLEKTLIDLKARVNQSTIDSKAEAMVSGSKDDESQRSEVRDGLRSLRSSLNSKDPLRKDLARRTSVIENKIIEMQQLGSERN